MLTASIIDDEIDSIEALSSLIDLYNIDLKIVGTGSSVEEGISTINQNKPEIIFTDVRLGNELCFSIFESLPEQNAQVIFISGHDQYAVKAFKYSAVDFLLKPIDPDELILAVKKAESNIRANKSSFDHLKALLDNYKAPRPFMLSVPTSDGLEFVNIDDIIDIKAEGSYSILSFIGKINMMVSKNIGEFQEQLPQNEFCRVHNSFIINLKHVKKLRKKGGLSAEMPEGKSIPIARNRKDTFMQKINSFVIHK